MKVKTLLLPDQFGKTDMLDEEKNDCTVRALANATGKSYETCLYLCDRAGRKPKSGLCILAFSRMCLNLGFNLQLFGSTPQVQTLSRGTGVRANENCKTIKTMLESGLYSKGKFIFGTKNHVFAVIDGKIIDNGGNYSTTNVIEVFTL